MFFNNSKQLNVNKKTNINIKLTYKKNLINIKTNFFIQYLKKNYDNLEFENLKYLLKMYFNK